MLRETTRACETGRYVPSEDATDAVTLDVVALRARAPYSVRYDFESAPAVPAGSGSGSAGPVHVVRGDCVDAALLLRAAGHSPLVLNMASDKRPGGGFRHGAGAQEENLFRRTSYQLHLCPPPVGLADRARLKYPLGEAEAIYSPDVLVLRGRESAGYPWLPRPVPMAFLALPGYRRPQLASPQRLAERTAQGLMRKVELLVRIAVHHGHDALVLSALGCGAFCNPPSHVAQLFALQLKHSGVLDGATPIRRVVFAILEDHNSGKSHNPHGNVVPFAEAFHTATLTPEEFAAQLPAATTCRSMLEGWDKLERAFVGAGGARAAVALAKASEASSAAAVASEATTSASAVDMREPESKTAE